MKSLSKCNFLKVIVCSSLVVGCLTLASRDFSAVAAFAQDDIKTSAASNSSEITTGDVTITKPTAQEIREKYANIRAYSANRFKTEPSVTSPYSIGALPEETLQNGEDWLNFMRYAANLPSITLTDELNESAQYASVVMAANKVLSHTPSKPSDMEQTFFDKGYYACNASNIAYSSAGPLSYFNNYKLSALARAVQGWMDDDDASNIKMVGHRRWVLNPSTKTFGLGSADTTGLYEGNTWGYSFSALRVMNRTEGSAYPQVDTSGNVNYEVIAWPASGYFPNNVFEVDTPWSITLNPSKYETPSANDVTVTLTDKTNAKTWTFSKVNSQDGAVDLKSDFFAVDTQGAGVANCIIFKPGDVGTTKMTGSWDVSISGIKKKGQSTSTTITYEVNFLDMNDISSSTVTLDDIDLTYSGYSKQPTPTVVLGSKTLKRDTDYKVTYLNNKNAGEATMTIEGIGNYSGTITKQFTITKKSLTITYGGETITFGDTPKLALTYSGFALGEDESVLSSQPSITAANLNAGTQTLTPSGASADNYDITYVGGQLTINTRNITLATSSTIARQPYTGSAITPSVSLLFRAKQLVEGEDYSLAYSNNTNVGTATVTVTGINNFSGTSELTFEIYDTTQPSINVAKITGSGTVKVNGKPLKEGEGITYADGELINVSWLPEQVGTANLTLIKSIKVNGVDQDATSKIVKSKWQVANNAYRSLMFDTVAMMTTFDAVKNAEQSVSLGAISVNADTNVTSLEVEFAEYVPVYRLYNMITSEHLFTTNKTEYDNFVKLCDEGKDVWIGEGIDWFAEVTPQIADSNTVRRFYNAGLGAMGRSSHYYSKDETEIATLLQNGWVDDGAENYIQSGGTVPIWTCYNEGLGSAHHYTSNKTEWEGLEQHQWALEKDKNGTLGVFQAVMSAKP